MQVTVRRTDYLEETMARWLVRTAAVILATAFTVSCSGSPDAAAKKYARRGDEYARGEKFREAVIEYKNAVQAAPGDAALRWKLATAALEIGDFATAVASLQKAVELDPNNYEAKGKLGELYLVAGRTDEVSRIADELEKVRPGDAQGYILKSGVAIRSGKTDSAIILLKKAVELDPKSTRSMLALGGLYLIKRDRAGAAAWYDKALNAAPDKPEVRVARGNYFFAIGDPAAGEAEYRTAIEHGGKRKEDLRIALAEHYLYQGRFEDSEKELDNVIREMNSQRARKALAEIRLERGKTAEAKTLVDSILKENEKDLDGMYLKGRIALAERRVADARTLFGEVVRKDATMARARLYNGMTEIMSGQVEVGKKEVAEAVRLAPEDIRARLVLGDLYLKSNAPAAAEREALAVLSRNPANLPAALIYGDSFLLRKDWRKAEQVYTAMTRQLPANAVGYFKMGLSKRLQGRPQEASSFFMEAVKRNPQDLASVNEYVFALMSAKQPGKAKEVVEEYRAKDPKNPLVWDMAGRFFLAARSSGEAEAAFLKAIELAPDFVKPYYELGVLYASERKLPESEARLLNAVQKNDRDVGVLVLLGVVQNSLGKIDEANKRYRHALDLAPRNTLAANNLAANLSDHGGNLDEALKFAQTAREAAPDDPNVAETLGWVYYRKGLYESAAPLLAEASAKLSKNASVRYHYGMLLAKRGKKKEAAAELSAALAISGRFAGAEEARQTLAAIRGGSR